MLIIRKIVGDSMLPTLRTGNIIVASRRKSPQIGDIVIAHVADREVVKRVSSKTDRGLLLMGDNAAGSTDSRDFGAVSENMIRGVVIMKLRFAHTVPAPEPTRKSQLCVPYILAVIIAVVLLIQLATFDKFVPILQSYSLPGGEVVTKFVAAAIVLAQLFSLPFLLRMTLSPLARLISAFSSLVAIILWFLMGAWALRGGGSVTNSGILSSVVSVAWGIELFAALLLVFGLIIWSYGILNLPAIFRQAPAIRR